MGASHGVSWPRVLRKIFSGPHSQASTSSAKPSPSRSLHTAPLTRPASASARVFSASRVNAPRSLRNSRDGVASGDQVVLRAGAFLRDGDAVSAVPAEDARSRP